MWPAVSVLIIHKIMLKKEENSTRINKLNIQAFQSLLSKGLPINAACFKKNDYFVH